MNSNWNDEQFDQWLDLRNKYRQAKKNKNFEEIINCCEQILELDKKAKFIKILVPLFQKYIGEAYLNLGKNQESKKYFISAIEGFIQYRKEKTLNKPDDWLKDIERLQKKVDKLSI